MSQETFPHLSSRFSRGRLRLRNRMVMAPMDCSFAEPSGEVSPRMIAAYRARAEGGAGLVMVGATSVEAPRGRLTPRQLRADDDQYLPGLRQLARAIRGAKAVAVLQLHHAGRKATSMITGEQPVAPSPIHNHFGETPRELRADEIPGLVESFAAAAARARMAGFDGIELHAAHGYLLSQFLSPTYNQRRDEYGGSLESRARFLLEVVAAVRRRVGASYPLLCRLSALECRGARGFPPLPGGITLEETRRVARWLEEAAVDALDISVSLVGKVEVDSVSWPEAALLPYAEEIRRAVDIPVIACGRIPPRIAESAVREKRIDLIAMGRALIADPELPKKLLEGRDEDVRPCIFCDICTSEKAAFGSTCAVNPAFGREREAIRPKASKPSPASNPHTASNPRTVVVAGGGPGGLEATLTHLRRGDKVILYEARDRLGGGLSRVPEASPEARVLGDLRRFLTRQVESAGADLRLGIRLTPNLVRETAPDLLILATGAAEVDALEAAAAGEVVHLGDGDGSVAEELEKVMLEGFRAGLSEKEEEKEMGDGR